MLTPVGAPLTRSRSRGQFTEVAGNANSAHRNNPLSTSTMLSPRGSLPSLFILTLLSLQAFAIQVVVPSVPQGGAVVQANFLGISFELSFLDKYCELWLGLPSVPPR